MGFLIVLAIAVGAALAPATPLKAVPSEFTVPNFAALAKEYGPAVVNIGVERAAVPRRGAAPVPLRPGAVPPQDAVEEDSLGSGFIVSDDGYILTNAHVVAHSDAISVKLTDRREFKAKLIGLDQVSDVALLKIDATGLPTVEIGDPAKTEVGDWVLAIGSPYGFTNSVTAGIISAKGRVLPGAYYMPFLQSDVAINPGNSGGPLFNLDGKVVGINSRIFSRTGGYQGLSFSIPIDVAMRIKDQLQATGTVTRGRIGIMVQEVNQALAHSFKLPRPEGALVSIVSPKGAADVAGLKPGDVILQVQGKNVVQSGDALGYIADIAPGTIATLSIWRDGKQEDVNVAVDRVQAPPAPAVANTNDNAPLGIVVRPLLPQERQVLRIDAGLLVQRVNPAALRAGVKPGDLILALNGQPVSTIEALAAEVAQADGAVALLVQRGSTRIFIPIDVPREPATAG